jgi:hypothetical protein
VDRGHLPRVTGPRNALPAAEISQRTSSPIRRGKIQQLASIPGVGGGVGFAVDVGEDDGPLGIQGEITGE